MAYHDRCAMKVGTDGVLLGAWADVVSARNILDIGTGTGLISLMMAQRCNARIRAVDIDADAVEQARGNVAASPWQDRIEVELQDICHFTSETLFDVIVSNPPYFTDSLKCPGKQRNIARHTDFLEPLFQLLPFLLLLFSLFQLVLFSLPQLIYC